MDVADLIGLHVLVALEDVLVHVRRSEQEHVAVVRHLFMFRV